MYKRLRHRMPVLGARRSSDVASALLIAVSCLLFIHSSNLRSSLDEITISEPSAQNDLHEESPSGQLRSRSGHEGHAGPLSNLTGEAEQQDLVIFTKIKRCGGTPMGHILHQLSDNGRRFSVWDEDPYKTKRLLPETDKEALNAVKEMDAVSKPAVIIKDMSHLDFKARGHRKPIYVSMLRHPLDHAHSWFYWLRAPYAVVERARSQNKEDVLRYLPKATFLKKNFDTCVQEVDPECAYKKGSKRTGHPMQAFCARSDQCTTFGGEQALEEAKRVVEQEYAVVGILEDWDTSLAVLEALVPRFFEGASNIYRDKIMNNRTLRNENFYKPKLSPATRKKLESSFRQEIELYEYIKQRLYQQYESLKSSS